MKLEKGDYVLATKYSDGGNQDQWCVGFFHSMLPKTTGERYMVVDSDGNQFRGNGFRRCEKITQKCGERLLLLAKHQGPLSESLWWFKNSYMPSKEAT